MLSTAVEGGGKDRSPRHPERTSSAAVLKRYSGISIFIIFPALSFIPPI
ncbi:hypothetical protein HMPREF1548_00580 [Clostridium sp. KLE 1755]|nr:hypothetical protein HMPREF1548_00580 [Clostridium sp. KLE 1755]